MNNSIREVLNRRARSRFFTRRCCVSEKRSKVFTLFLLALAMGLYAYLQISVMVEAYSNPVRQVNAVVLKELSIPGLYICQPMVNLTDGSWWRKDTPAASLAAVQAYAGSVLNMLADPRTSFAPMIVTNNPTSVGIPLLLTCCKTTFLDYFVDCFTYARTCPVQMRYQFGGAQLTSTYGNWNIKFQCVNVAPGVTFYEDSDNLFIPWFLTNDNGVLSRDANWGVSNRSDAGYDVQYLYFCNNFVYWPKKTTMFSYLGIENLTNTVDIYYQASGLDDIIGGSQNRIRTDLGNGITSVALQHYTYTDINLNPVTSLIGWTTSFDLTLPPLPWTSVPSFYGTGGRVSTAVLVWCRVHVTMAEVRTQEAILFTYLDLVTTILSIIGSAAALVHIVVGPGDYEPKGLLNKLFYNDVPVLHNAASDVLGAAIEKKDKKKEKESKEKS